MFLLGLPRWCSGYESTCQCRGHGFEPWSRKIPHAAEQLSPCTTTRAHKPQLLRPCATTPEPACCNYWSPWALRPMRHNYWAHMLQLLKPACLEPMLCNKRSHRNENTATKSSPRLPQLEKARAQQQRPNAAKNK